jgi:FKBP-type peptidyl-prolyl cis-trans isomerase 2
MIPGFEAELMGARTGERRMFTVEPEKAYGWGDENYASIGLCSS